MTILPQDTERLRILLAFGFGFSVLAVYFALALVIALGRVEQATSHGLDIVLGALGPLGGLFCSWAFRQSRGPDGPSAQ